MSSSASAQPFSALVYLPAALMCIAAVIACAVAKPDTSDSNANAKPRVEVSANAAHTTAPSF